MKVLDPRWQTPPINLTLPYDAIHVWLARLDLPATRLHALEQALSTDERERANRFRFPTDRSRFIAARGLLRSILGNYLSREPASLRFCYSPYGKPALAAESAGDPMLFNVTHSQGMALYAFTHIGAIGIDLEHFSADTKDYENIALHFFSAAEVETLRAVSASSKQEAFLNCWTRKEAYIKARGLGLSLPLSQFDVSLTPGAPATLLATREAGQETTGWFLAALAPGADCIAALAVHGQPGAITCWQVPE